MKKRIVSIFMAFLLVLPLCPAFAFTASAVPIVPPPFVPPTPAPTPSLGDSGSGTESDPYIIRNASEWNRTTMMTDKYYKLSDDFDNSSSPVTTPASGSLRRVNFDGNGRTLTVNISDVNGEGTAPFRHLAGDCVIKNLTVRGTVTGAAYASGLVGISEGTNRIENCIVDVDVRLPGDDDYRFGGVVGNVLTLSRLTVTDTAFTGTLYNTCPGYATGGIIGWVNDSAQIVLGNCLFGGQYVGEAKEYFHPIAIKGNGCTFATSFRCDNMYYVQAAGLKNSAYIFSNNGTRVYSPAQYGLMRTNIELFGERYSTDEKQTVRINVPEVLLYTGEVFDLDAYPPTATDGTELIRGVDYTLEVSPSPIMEKGFYALSYTGIGEYTGTTAARVFVGGADYHLINSDTLSWNGGTYFLDGSVTVPERITVTGDVRLHLFDGAVLTASKGIRVGEGNSLIIEADGDTAELHVNATGSDAGIGGDAREKNGTITIESGTVCANSTGDAAAIGGGRSCKAGESITINGGTVDASGGTSGAAIGSGYNGDCGDIVINGGTVTVRGGYSGAAIGSGFNGSFGQILINGGTVTAQAGDRGAGIGAGGSGDNRGSVTINGGTVTAMTFPENGSHGAAIGGGADTYRFCSVTINGGTVTAESNCSAAAIGAGNGNTAGGRVTINGGKVTARATRDYSAAIGADKTAIAGVTINGGVVAAYAQGYGSAISTGYTNSAYSITLGWTNLTDSIYASSYSGTVSLAEHKSFMRGDNGDYVTTRNIGGVTIVPLTRTLHYVTVNAAEHAAVSVDTGAATEGQTVTVTWRAEYPYVAESVTVRGEAGYVSFTRTGPCSGTFCMPEENVTVTVFMEAVPDKTITTTEGTFVCRPIVRGITDYESGWYYVSGEFPLGGRMNIHGDVKIYLCEDALLDCSGINVRSGNSLTIEGTGALKSISATDDPGIGGISNSDSGTIVIRSGVIEARGGYLASGIGSDNKGNCGSITILGGTVTAIGGGFGAGIGAGQLGRGGSVTILGGKVTARSKDNNGPGIGGDGVSILLDWTNEDDFISLSRVYGNVQFAEGKYFRISGSSEIARKDNIRNSLLIPYTDNMYGISLISPDSSQGEIRLIGAVNYNGEAASTTPVGAVVRVSAIPVYPYECGGLTVTTSSGVAVPWKLERFDSSACVYSFVMPADDVTVTAVMNPLTPVQRVTPEGTFSFMPLRAAYAAGMISENEQGVCVVVDRNLDLASAPLTFLDGCARLYLDAGCTLKCDQIILGDNCSGITIYGEGTLIVDASSHDLPAAGIGPHGNITIYGGTIIAKGGFEGAGIGGFGTGIYDSFASFDVEADCTITIHGGNITAKGGLFAAGIGGGYQQRVKAIVIDGGTINATGGQEGAGIGGGLRGSGGSITVSGGTITARGGFRGTGVGGGMLGPGGVITVSGGVINAKGGFEAAGIGGGSGSPGGNITITGGEISATGGGSNKSADDAIGYGAGIGGGAKAGGNGANIVITGGQITARGGYDTDWSQAGYPRLYSYGIGHGWKSDVNDTITLGWTNPDDFIDAGGEYGFGGAVSFADGKGFVFGGSVAPVTAENINSAERIVPNYCASIKPPTAINGLAWNGEAQELVLPGITAGGTLKFCLSDSQPNDAAYTEDIPTAVEPGVYTVWYKAFGDEDHLDTAPVSMTVKIAKVTVDDPTVILSQTEYTYGKTARTPDVTVKDGADVIDPSEYTVTYENNICAGTATVTVSAKENGHYIFTSGASFTGSAAFTIAPLTVTIGGLAVEDKLFDDSTAATVTGTPVISGVLAGDDVTLSEGFAAFVTPNMGAGKTVFFDGYTLTGADAENYALLSQPVSVTADITALPIGTGSTLLETASYVTLARSFTPDMSDVYRFSANSSLFPAFFIYDGDDRICECRTGSYLGYFDVSVELEAGKDYMIQLYTGYEAGELTLTIERAPVCAVTVDRNTAHGMIVDLTEEARMGDRVYVFTEAEDGYALNRLVVTASTGESVEVEPDGFIMPGSPVTVSAVFGKIRTVDIECPGGVELWEFSPFFYANGEFIRPGEEETVAACGAEIEIDLWSDGLHVLSASVATSSGDELPVTYYKEFGVWILLFTMPDEDVTVTLTLTENADFNKDGESNVIDVSTLLDLLSILRVYVDAYDLNGDGIFSVSDVTALLDHLANQ